MLFSHLKLHVVVLIYGFTAILGKLISLSAIHLVWYRMLIASVSLFVYLLIRRVSVQLPFRDVMRFLLIGLIVAIHWITFFGAIKLSNVSVTLGCLAATTLFTGILEPLFYRKRLNLIELAIGLFTIIGLYLIFQFEFHYWKGIVTAVISAFLAGLFTVMNKKQVERFPARVISLYEMAGGFAGISLFLLIRGFKEPFTTPLPAVDLIYLLLLGIVCTSFAFVVQVDVMRELTAFIVSLTINLEPIYGILLAFFFFGENELMSLGFYLGTLLILLSVFGYPLYKKYAAGSGPG